MYFKRLEMQGFKSFADPVVIDFHEGITCVVGPNGSGKSNISDAIRWVLGEQSPKALRGGKMEEVIFAGTASRKSRGMAEVVLVIDNSERILDIDYSEVAITRRMYRSGESEYLINNNPCRLRDIRELIMDTGIGVDGYSIIGQGKIADIVSTKPEARREIFEEAAGVVMYKTKRGEAVRKLESTNANLERVRDIIAELEGRIDTLREDSIKAKEYLELKKNYQELEINVILRNIDTIQENSQVYRDDLDRLSKEIEEASQNHQNLSVKYGELGERRAVLERLAGETRDSILKLVEEINEIDSANKLSAERLSGIDNETGIINADLELIKERLSQDEASLAKLKEEEDALDREIAKAKEILDQKIIQYNEAAATQAASVERADKGRERLFELNSELASCDSEIKGIENIRENLTRRRTELDSLSSETGKITDELKNTVVERSKEKEDKEREYSTIETELKGVSQDRGSKSERIREITEALERDRIELSKLNARRRTMEEMESNYDGYTAGVRSAMKANFPGNRGVVAELMRVPKGYETAIETALGGKLQNIICETDEDAKKAINYLKENKGGRATFLPIQSIRARKEADILAIKNEEGYIDLADNIIQFDEELRSIYSYLLGLTVVTKDLDSAIRLAKKGTGLKFVTMGGEIVNSQGAITGGALKNQTANILERKAEINELGETVDSLEKKCKENEDLLDNTRKEFTALSEKEQHLSGEMHRLDIELSALTRDIQAITESLEKEALSGERYGEEIARIAAQMAETQTMTEKQQTRIKEINVEIENTTKEIEEALAKAEEDKLATSNTSEAVTSARIALNEIETRGDSQKDLRDRVENQVNSYKSQIREKEEQISALVQEKETLIKSREEGEGVEAKLLERASIEESLANLEKDRTTIDTELKEMEERQKEAFESINNLKDQRYQIEIKSTRGETQLETLKEKLWDEFEVTYAQAADMRKEDFVYSRAVKETREIRNRIRQLGDVNVGAIQEYEQVSERYEFLTAQRDDINQAKVELLKIIEDMDNTIKTKFKDNFDKVVDNFQSIFVELFGGGQAELRLENEEDPLNSGIEIVAQPPGKKLQNINLMSGGEKTMTAIALMFAVLKTKPTPFCILDEVEAALDDNNIDRFANYLKNFNDIQFTLVTHQKATMEHADVLYGVTMPEHGISKMLSLRLGDDFDLD
ncbi:MAG: chromosome segregation protein SMC [Firmicutes bacterium]|nr:chromosome segregation protein SMC [Bacillota bacterium]